MRGPSYYSQHALHDKIHLICQTLLRKTSRVTAGRREGEGDASAHIITRDCLTHPPPSSRALDEITGGFGPQPASQTQRNTQTGLGRLLWKCNRLQITLFQGVVDCFSFSRLDCVYSVQCNVLMLRFFNTLFFT